MGTEMTKITTQPIKTRTATMRKPTTVSISKKKNTVMTKTMTSSRKASIRWILDRLSLNETESAARAASYEYFKQSVKQQQPQEEEISSSSSSKTTTKMPSS